jgi:replicative DNA helicase
MTAKPSDLFLERTLPSNVEAEKSVLGAILLDNRLCNQAMELLRRDDFYLESHRKLFDRMIAISEQGRPIDTLTLSDELRKAGDIDAVGGVAYVASLMDSIPRLENIEYYARMVKEMAMLRRLIAAGNQIIALAFEQQEPVPQIVDSAERLIFTIAEDRARDGFVDVGSVAHKRLEEIEAMGGRTEMITGVPTGFAELDKKTAGLQKSDLIILAARPSMGKTSFALNVAQYASKAGYTVGVFSLEMSSQQLVSRLLCSEAHVDAHRFRTGYLNREEWQRLAAGLQRMTQTKVFIDDTPGITTLEMRAKARRLKQEHGLDLLVVDYLQLIQGRSTRGSDSRTNEVSQISRDLKMLAKELDVPLVALSQLSRAPETRTDHRPQLADLRESGCLAGETLVTLADTGARVPIADLVGKSGFRVWALDEVTYRIVPATVSRAFATGRKPVYRMETRLGRTVRATGNHKFRTLDGWRRLDELREGDRIAMPRAIPCNPSSDMSDAEVALLAHLIGDGCTLPRHAIQYTTRDLEIAERVVDFATSVFGGRIAPRIERERQWYQVYLPASFKLTHGKRSPVAEWMDELGVFGLRSHEKRVPDRVFRQSARTIGTFLRHLWATDGCIFAPRPSHNYPSIYYTSSSERLVEDVQSLLLCLGINAVARSVSQGSKGRPQFTVTVTGREDVLRFAECVGAMETRRRNALQESVDWVEERTAKTNRDVVPSEVWSNVVEPALVGRGMTAHQLQEAMGRTSCGTRLFEQNVSRARLERVCVAVGGDSTLEALARSEVYWDRIATIVPDGETEVFDLTVDVHHNFVASNSFVHNSIEQDADVVAFIYREEVYNQTEENANMAELIIGKQRNGPIGTVKLAFLKEFTRFENLYTDGY